MLKSNLRIAFLTGLLLLSTHGLFLDDLFKITIETTASTGKIRLEYSNGEGRRFDKTAQIMKDGHASARVYAGKMEKIKITVPSEAEIKNIKIAGKKKWNFKENKEEIFSHSFKPSNHFDFKIFVLAAFLYASIFNVVLKKKVLFDDNVPKMMNMEILRLFFTLGIVAYHLAERLDIFNEGWLGVEFFFILSGFFLTLTFNPDRSTGDFIKSKIIHFTPLLFLCAFLGKAKVIPVLSNVLFLQSTGLSDDVVPVQSWYLAVLFWVSLFYFYMMKICPAKANKLIFALLTFFSYSACRHYGWDGMVADIFSVRLLRGVAGMGLGCFTAYFYQAAMQRQGGNTLFYTAAESVVLFYAIGLMFIKNLCPENKIVAVVTFFFLILLFGLKRGKVSSFFDKPFFAKISACSFSVYMTHWFLEMDVVLRWNEKYPVLQNHKYAVLTGTVLLAYVVGIFVWKYVEKPSIAFLKKVIK